MERQLGTDLRDVPHEFKGFDECGVCGRGVKAPLHVEWSRVERASRETASGVSRRGVLPRVEG